MDRNPFILIFKALIEVALRKESVDRNIYCDTDSVKYLGVALRKESVDRNSFAYWLPFAASVALRKESVDRNHYVCQSPRC